jgi:hypothetical protein
MSGTTEEEARNKVMPWALVLKDMVEYSADDTNRGMTFGEMIRYFCIRRGVPYPPRDVESALLTAAARRVMLGAPPPKGFA